MMKKEKVLIFAPFNFAPSFLGLNLEFLQNELDNGHELTYVTCDSTFKTCGFNTFGLKYMCAICKQRFHQHKGLVHGDFRTVRLSDFIQSDDTTFADQSLLGVHEIQKGYVVETFEVGDSVYSSFISKTKEKNFSSPEEMEVLKTLAHQSLVIYSALKRLIEQEAYSRIILFNGRWDYYRAALAAARFRKVEIQVIENLRSGGYFEEFGDALPHSIKVKNELIEKHWNAEPNLQAKQTLARDFFVRKRAGSTIMGKSFTQDQIKGHVPSYIDSKKKLIVIYNSSDYEFEAVGEEYSNPFFRDQTTSIQYVAELISHEPEFQLVIRMHPNLGGLQRGFLEPIYQLAGKYPNVFVIRPEDVVDSYALMEQAFKVITYVSTMGIESAYWGKPVVLLGRSLYSYADVAYTPPSIEEIPTYLLKPLEPKPRLAAEKYGYYFLTGGLKARYYLSEEGNRHSFKGQLLSDFPSWFNVYYKTLKALHVRN